MGVGVWVWGLGFGVWGRGFRVWDLGFGVLGGWAVSYERGTPVTAGERGGNNLHGFEEFRYEIGPSQGQNLALTGLCVPRSLKRGSLRAMDCAGGGHRQQSNSKK